MLLLRLWVFGRKSSVYPRILLLIAHLKVYTELRFKETAVVTGSMCYTRP